MKHSVLALAFGLFLIGCSGGSVATSDGGAAEGGAASGAASVTGADGGADASAPGCTPGGQVFCRCSNRDEGTKTCASDGMSFEPCKTATGPCP